MISRIFPSRKGLTALQRGPRCITAAAPLRDNGHAARDQRGPYGLAAGTFLYGNGMQMSKSGRSGRNFGGFSSVKFRDIIWTCCPALLSTRHAARPLRSFRGRPYLTLCKTSCSVSYDESDVLRIVLQAFSADTKKAARFFAAL